jgi:hypothetical protein
MYKSSKLIKQYYIDINMPDIDMDLHIDRHFNILLPFWVDYFRIVGLI